MGVKPSAQLAVLVSQVLPDGVKHFGPVDGVWVCNFISALPLAAALRSGLIVAAFARLVTSRNQGILPREQILAAWDSLPVAHVNTFSLTT
jgi:hypothetical protein